MLDSKLKQLAEKMGWTDDDVNEFIVELQNRLNHNEQHEASSTEKMLENEIFFALSELGFMFNKKGSEYLMIAIIEVVKDPYLIYNFSKNIYQKLSTRYGVTESSIIRDMRYAISKAYEQKGNEGSWSKYFSANRKPRNVEFISNVANFIRMRRLG